MTFPLSKENDYYYYYRKSDGTYELRALPDFIMRVYRTRDGTVGWKPTECFEPEAIWKTTVRVIDGFTVVETIDILGGGHCSQSRFKHAVIQCRTLRADRTPYQDGSPWRALTAGELACTIAARGVGHPHSVLDHLEQADPSIACQLALGPRRQSLIQSKVD